MSYVLAAVFFAVGFALPTTLVTDAVASLLMTFFGLMSAAVLAALSLLVGNVMSSALTVAKLIALKAELDALVSRLAAMLAVLVIGSFLVVILNIGLPGLPYDLIARLPEVEWLRDIASGAPQKSLQGGVMVCLGYAADRVTSVSQAFRKVLQAQFELALADSRKRVEKSAPDRETIRATFPTSDTFGERVPRQK